MLYKHYLKQMHSKWCPGQTHKDKSHILHITRNILQGYFLPQLTCLSLPIHNLHNKHRRVQRGGGGGQGVLTPPFP